jgi:hypothetical protein
MQRGAAHLRLPGLVSVKTAGRAEATGPHAAARLVPLPPERTADPVDELAIVRASVTPEVDRLS